MFPNLVLRTPPTNPFNSSQPRQGFQSPVPGWLSNIGRGISGAANNVIGALRTPFPQVANSAIDQFNREPAWPGATPTTPSPATPTPAQHPNLPSMSQFNSQFMQNNPQFGNASTGAPPSAPGGQTQIPGSVPGVGNVPDITKYGSAGIPAGAPTTPPSTPYQIQNTPYTASVNQSGGVPGVFQTALGQQLGVATGGGQGPVQQPMSTLQGIAQNQTAQVQQAENAYDKFITQTEPGLLANQANLPMAANVSAGRGQVLGNQLANTAQGLGQAYGAAVQGEQQQIAAAQQAGQLGLGGQGQAIQAGQNVLQTPGVSPTLGQYGQTYYQFGGGQGGGNLDPASVAGNLADQVISGRMSYQDAVGSLGYAGNAGQTFLNQALQQKSPGFNINQAQQNVQTQGTITPMANQANQDLNILNQTLNNLPGWANTGIPVVNSITRWVGSMVGNQPVQAVNDAEGAAKSAVQTTLQTGYNMTPTDAGTLVSKWFPPGATPQQVQTGIEQFNKYIQARQAAFTSPGTTQYTPQSSPTTAGGGALIRNAEGIWVPAP